ncbi:hypothetical protein J2Y67_005208 [Neobacillus niacini]|nr:hypothetical protein [Neobacillus niacini]
MLIIFRQSLSLSTDAIGKLVFYIKLNILLS